MRTVTTATEDLRGIAAELGRVTDPLEAISVLRRLDAECDTTLRRMVALARKRGVSWQAVADQLDTTRQAAWERFGP